MKKPDYNSLYPIKTLADLNTASVNLDAWCATSQDINLLFKEEIYSPTDLRNRLGFCISINKIYERG